MKKWVYLMAGCFLISSESYALLITEFTVGTTQYGSYYETFGDFIVLGRAQEYLLNDGSTWTAGAGTHPYQQAKLDSLAIEDGKIRYTFDMAIGDIVFHNIDYNSGNHSAQGTFTTLGPIVLEADCLPSRK